MPYQVWGYFYKFLTKAVNTPTSKDMVEQKKMSHDSEETAELNSNEECVIGPTSEIGNLRNFQVTSDRNVIRNIAKESEEPVGQLTNLVTNPTP